jgi:hypothetical protein
MAELPLPEGNMQPHATAAAATTMQVDQVQLVNESEKIVEIKSNNWNCDDSIDIELGSRTLDNTAKSIIVDKQEYGKIDFGSKIETVISKQTLGEGRDAKYPRRLMRLHCFICGSIDHKQKFCPKNRQERQTKCHLCQDIHICRRNNIGNYGNYQNGNYQNGNYNKGGSQIFPTEYRGKCFICASEDHKYISCQYYMRTEK